MMESSLCIYKGKIQEAINLVPGMNAEYKLKAVQYWNAVSEHLQDIVNKSASDFNGMDSTDSRHDVNRSEQQVVTTNQAQTAQSSASAIETQVYNIVSSNSSVSRSTNDLFLNEFLTDTSECGSGLASPSTDQQASSSLKKDDSNEDNQNNSDNSSNNNTTTTKNNNLPTTTSDAYSNDEDSLMHMMERTIKDQQQQSVKDNSNDSTTSSLAANFASSPVLGMSQANQASTNPQTVIVTTDSTLLANNLASRTSPLSSSYMIDSSTILPSSIPMTSTGILIGNPDSTTVSSSSDDTNRINSISTAQTINLNDVNSLQNSMISVDSRTYVTNTSNHVASGIVSSSPNVRAQAIQAHPPLIPPIISNSSSNSSSSIIHSQAVVPSHSSPIQTYHASAIQHQLQPLNGYEHHIAVQHSRPLQQHQLINYEMVGLNPEYNNYIQTFLCDICGKHLDNSDDLSQHRALHSPEGTIRDNNDLNHQNRTTLNIVSSDSSGGGTNANLSIASNQHTCNVCGKSGFSTKGNLKRHLRAHSGEKPFKCEYCESRFTEKKSLKIHLRRHTGEKPYKCDICGKLFSQTGVLQSHMALHLNERKFGCNLCGKAFRQRSQLKLHIMRHEGVKRLECSTCSAKFLTKGDLERHYRIHTGERPYECKICKKTFTRQQSLNEHLNRHYGTKPYSCPSCDKTFSEMSACYKHAKIHKKQEAN